MKDFKKSIHQLPSHEERQMLRDSVRGYLETNWPANKALARSESDIEVQVLWQGLVNQGLATLGHDPCEGGLREIVILMEEAGRAACPAPLLGASLFNLLMSRLDKYPDEAKLLQLNLHLGTVRLALASNVKNAEHDPGALTFTNG